MIVVLDSFNQKRQKRPSQGCPPPKYLGEECLGSAMHCDCCFVHFHSEGTIEVLPGLPPRCPGEEFLNQTLNCVLVVFVVVCCIRQFQSEKTKEVLPEQPTPPKK